MMKISLRDFFKHGEFWTNLDLSITKLNDRISQHDAAILQSGEQSKMLLLLISHLQEENRDLKNRMATLEERVWNLNIVSRTDGHSVVQDNDGNSGKTRIPRLRGEG